MARTAFVNDKTKVAGVLQKMRDGQTVRLLEAPASYYLMEKLKGAGLVRNAKFGMSTNGRTIKGFSLTAKGKKLAEKHRGSNVPQIGN